MFKLKVHISNFGYLNVDKTYVKKKCSVRFSIKVYFVILTFLVDDNSVWAKSHTAERTDYTITSDEVFEIEERHNQLMTQNYNMNQSSSRGIASVDKASVGPALIENEELSQCDNSRKFYEKQIKKSSKIKELLVVNDSRESKLSKKCITHIMNKFAVSKYRYANCPKSSGATQTPGAKPCVTENLVNLTYNSYMDVTECLNLDPKLLFPKIGYESGFLINTLGSGHDGGLGQLTRPAIAEVNNYVDQYLQEIEEAAATKPSCARILKYKAFFKKAPEEAQERCSVIGLPENPLKNILYMALLNRVNMDQISGIKYVAGYDMLPMNRGLASLNQSAKDELGGTFKLYEIKEKLIKLGIKKPNMHFFKEIIGLIGYNTGVHTAVSILRNYLDLRVEKNLKLSMKDFDFNNPAISKDDVTGEAKDVVAIARSYVMSPFGHAKDSEKIKKEKAKKHKMLPKNWANAYKKTFPEFLAYRANAYDGKSKKKYGIYGYPGYLNLVAERNRTLRDEFEKSNLDPNLCSDPNFLKMKN